MVMGQKVELVSGHKFGFVKKETGKGSEEQLFPVSKPFPLYVGHFSCAIFHLGAHVDLVYKPSSHPSLWLYILSSSTQELEIKEIHSQAQLSTSKSSEEKVQSLGINMWVREYIYHPPIVPSFL